MTHRRLRPLLPPVLLMVGGCAVGPDYQPPQVRVGTNFGELDASTSANPATQPSSVHARGEPIVEWWTTLRDPQLTMLVQRAAAENLNVQRAASRVRQARAEVVIAGGRLLPAVNAAAGAAFARGSGNVVIPGGGLGGSGAGAAADGMTSGGTGGGGAGGTAGTAGGNTAAGRGSPTRIGRTSGVRPQQSTGGSSASSGGSGGSGSSGGGSGGSSGGSGSGSAGESGLSAARGGPSSPLGEGGLPGSYTELYQIGLDATWELDVFGGVRRGIEAADADLAAAVEDRRDVLTTLVAEVARDYLQLRGFQQRLVIARANLSTQQESLELTVSRFKAGFVTELDVSRARTQVANTQALIPPLEASVRQSIHAISTLIGQEPLALSKELEAISPLPGAPPDVPIGLPSGLLARRPDIRRAEKQIKAANARVGVATADLFPKFALTGGLGLDSSRARRLFDWDSRYFILSPGVSWALFEGGRVRANIQSQTEQRQQLMLAYQQTVLTALQETEDAVVGYATEQARHAALTDAEKAARASVDISRQQYKEGVVDFITVLDTQRELLSTQDQLVQSDQTIATNLVALYKALGGGWEIDAAREMERPG